MTDMKICTRCKQALPPERFSRNATRRDGLASQCKSCHAQWGRTPAYRDVARRRLREQRRKLREAGRCWKCGGKPMPGNTLCTRCRNETPTPWPWSG